MVARLLTGLVLLVAVGSVSWDIRAQGEDDCEPHPTENQLTVAEIHSTLADGTEEELRDLLAKYGISLPAETRDIERIVAMTPEERRAFADEVVGWMGQTGELEKYREVRDACASTDRGDTLEERVRYLEERNDELIARLVELESRSLPPRTDKPETDFQFFNPDPTYGFEMSCRIDPYPLPGGWTTPADVRMQCIRYRP